ncbi:hypothetical protein I302_105667 [Kwoniella bestiolae CBS 10118]|uniref:NADP-dependent oxidoreductase domain-containing protein n=1 Tax=Kwoniella bestiolae CBS 10118 TaxID=1296100 RepID=A0A1B9G1T2_9TREE|nr:hypothetical protein I302_04785 [Kwoniella bestiolae CBS 10118]OCF24975.1 hypothetical protein I302_04785 [Kwoniella bestiolae CBS 10118]
MSETMLFAGKPTIRMGLGLMGLTLNPEEYVGDDVAFEVIKTSLDGGATHLNSAMFYGPPDDGTANLKLLGRFFKKYPQYRDKAVLGVKGGNAGSLLEYSGDIDHLRNQLITAKSLLGGKKIDIFGCARVPGDRPFEETIHNLVQLHSEGFFKHIGLSETSASSMRLAHSIAPNLVISNEIEVSLQTLLDPNIVQNIKTAEELGITIIGYSPFGHGLLSGQTSVGEGDWRSHLPRFQQENLESNLRLVNELRDLAKRYGRGLSDLILGVLNGYSPVILPLPGTRNPKRVIENNAAASVKLTEEEMKEIFKILDRNPVVGTRYNAALMESLVRFSLNIIS